jgi:hypothetical protein
MNRRAFIKGVALSSLAGFAAISTPTLQASAGLTSPPAEVQVKTPGRMVKGTRAGQLFESLDGGSSWRPLVNFGPQYPILEIQQRQGALYARVGFQRYSFLLKSADGHTWRTVNALPAA